MYGTRSISCLHSGNIHRTTRQSAIVTPPFRRHKSYSVLSDGRCLQRRDTKDSLFGATIFAQILALFHGLYPYGISPTHTVLSVFCETGSQTRTSNTFCQNNELNQFRSQFVTLLISFVLRYCFRFTKRL